MHPNRITALRAELDAERISMGELHEIETAFDAVPDSAMSEPRENAMAGDMLDVLESMNTNEEN